jgi:hypothetical protein
MPTTGAVPGGLRRGGCPSWIIGRPFRSRTPGISPRASYWRFTTVGRVRLRRDVHELAAAPSVTAADRLARPIRDPGVGSAPDLNVRSGLSCSGPRQFRPRSSSALCAAIVTGTAPAAIRDGAAGSVAMIATVAGEDGMTWPPPKSRASRSVGGGRGPRTGRIARPPPESRRSRIVGDQARSPGTAAGRPVLDHHGILGQLASQQSGTAPWSRDAYGGRSAREFGRAGRRDPGDEQFEDVNTQPPGRTHEPPTAALRVPGGDTRHLLPPPRHSPIPTPAQPGR